MEIRGWNINDFLLTGLISGGSLEVLDHNKYPDHTEYEVTLGLAGG